MWEQVLGNAWLRNKTELEPEPEVYMAHNLDIPEACYVKKLQGSFQ